MKIAFVAQPWDALFFPNQNSVGIWNYEVASRIAREHETIVYSRSRPSAQLAKLGFAHRTVRAISLDRLQSFSSKYQWFVRDRRRPFFSSWLFNLEYALQVAADLRHLNCDIVHIHNNSQFIPIIQKSGYDSNLHTRE